MTKPIAADNKPTAIILEAGKEYYWCACRRSNNQRFFSAWVELMCVLARACGHTTLSEFSKGDQTSWKKETAELASISCTCPL